MHCSGVSETVRRDVPGKKLWISDLGRFNMFFYYVSKACRCKLSTPHVVEKWMLVVLRPIKSMLSHICHYKIEDVLVKRDAPFLTALGEALGEAFEEALEEALEEVAACSGIGQA